MHAVIAILTQPAFGWYNTLQLGNTVKNHGCKYLITTMNSYIIIRPELMFFNQS